MKLANLQGRFKAVFRSFALLTFLSIALLNCHSQAAVRCEDLFSQNETNWLDLYEHSPQSSKDFWNRTGETFRSTLEQDLNRKDNLAIYKKAIEEEHPHIKLLHSLGIYFVGGHFKVPHFFELVQNLERLLQKNETGFAPKFIWALKRPDSHANPVQTSLVPLQELKSPELDYTIKSMLLKNSEFTKMIAHGEFPIGGLESATGASRRTLTMSPHSMNLSDFFHDLAHLDVFTSNPEFAVVYRRVYTQKQIEIEKKLASLSTTEGLEYLSRVDRSNDPTSLLFSESSWVYQKEAAKYFEKMPVIKTLIHSENYVTDTYFKSTFTLEQQTQLLKEFRVLQKNWWKVINPLGGGSRDAMSFKGFGESLHFPMNFVFHRLQQINKAGKIESAHDIEQVTLILRFLQASTRLSISEWETFAASKEVHKTSLFAVLQNIFRDYRSRDANNLEMMAEFLRLPDPFPNNR